MKNGRNKSSLILGIISFAISMISLLVLISVPISEYCTILQAPFVKGGFFFVTWVTLILALIVCLVNFIRTIQIFAKRESGRETYLASLIRNSLFVLLAVALYGECFYADNFAIVEGGVIFLVAIIVIHFFLISNDIKELKAVNFENHEEESSIEERLLELKKLRDEEIITEEEFNNKKADLISKL